MDAGHIARCVAAEVTQRQACERVQIRCVNSREVFEGDVPIGSCREGQSSLLFRSTGTTVLASPTPTGCTSQ